jgi:hypothetical protein
MQDNLEIVGAPVPGGMGFQTAVTSLAEGAIFLRRLAQCYHGTNCTVCNCVAVVCCD